MKKLWLALIIFTGWYGLSAQATFYKTSWAPDGGSARTGNTVIQYTMGEVFVREAGTATHLSEGFIGPDMEAFLRMTEMPPVEGLHIYPNPVKDYLQLRFDRQAYYQVRIYDLSGKKLMETEVNGRRLQLDLRPLQSGYYLLIVTQPDENRFSSIKIQKI